MRIGLLALAACSSKAPGDSGGTTTGPTTDTETDDSGTTTPETDTGSTIIAPVAPDFTRRRVAAGDTWTCWLDTNYSTVSCVGEGDIVEGAPPGQYAHIAGGKDHACVLDSYGVATCWGSDTHGQIQVPPQTYWVDIAGGDEHTCGIATTGEISCWGNSSIVYGLLNAPAGAFAQVALGSVASCALDADGKMSCWGTVALPGQPTGATFREISVADFSACGITTLDTVFCWGDNSFGQTDAPSDGTWTATVADHLHTCALDSGGMATCWGNSDLDRLDVPLEGGFLQLDSGNTHTCALSMTDITCWGDNAWGQIP
jgi:alpha-tubulin suppressor-like RCC1 family protein